MKDGSAAVHWASPQLGHQDLRPTVGGGVGRRVAVHQELGVLGSHKGDFFELCCWSRLLRVPWTARRSNQPILKEVSPEYSLEGLMLKLKLQYFGHLM